MRRSCLEWLRIRLQRSLIAHRFAPPTSPSTRVDNRSTAFLLSVQEANNTSMACEKHEQEGRDLRRWPDCSNTSIRPRLNTPPTACQMQTPPFENVLCPLFNPKPRNNFSLFVCSFHGFNVGSFKKEASHLAWSMEPNSVSRPSTPHTHPTAPLALTVLRHKGHP